VRRNRFINYVARWGMVLLAAVLARSGLAQDVVTLRESAELPARGPVLLAQIAELSGPGAQALAGIEVSFEQSSAGQDGWLNIGVAEVRGALRKASDVNWGKLIVRGSTCAVRRASDVPPAKKTVAAEPETPEAEGPTVRAIVEKRVREVAGGRDEDVRLTFDDTARSLLDTSVAGRTADIQLLGTSNRQVVSVKLFEGLRQVASGTVRVEVSVRRVVAVSATGLRRGDTITAENVRTEERWIAPTRRPVDASKVVGRVARGRIDAGAIIEETDAESPVVVKKGDLVDVYCLSSSVNLKSVARALESGREGDSIRFQTAGSKRPFTARVDGPGRAVTGVGALPGAEGSEPLREVAATNLHSKDGMTAVREQASRRVRYVHLGDQPVSRPEAKPPGGAGTENQR